jgi:hypothetical protein
MPGVKERVLLTNKLGLSQSVTVDVCAMEFKDKVRKINKYNALILLPDR